MILADTSVWVEHLRTTNQVLQAQLVADEVLMHPFVVGELALGRIPERQAILASLERMPQVLTASHEEVMQLVDALALPGTGIGYVDVHLLAAARLTPGTYLWTFDRRLAALAAAAGLAFRAN